LGKQSQRVQDTDDELFSALMANSHLSVVSADITISGKLFHTFTILSKKKIFLNHSDIYYLLILGYL